MVHKDAGPAPKEFWANLYPPCETGRNIWDWLRRVATWGPEHEAICRAWWKRHVGEP